MPLYLLLKPLGSPGWRHLGCLSWYGNCSRKLETAHRLPELNLPGEQQQHRLRRLKPSPSPVKKLSRSKQEKMSCRDGCDTKYDCKVKPCETQPKKALTKRNMESFLSGLVLVCAGKQCVYAKTSNL